MALAGVCDPARAQSTDVHAPAPQAPTVVPIGSDAPVRTVNLPPALSVTSRFAATDNGGLDAPGSERRDYILSLRPELVFKTESAKFRFDFRGAATFVTYAQGTQANGVLPDLSSSLKASLVDEWLFLDAGVQIQNSAANPFGDRSDELTATNRRTETGYRFAPYIERHFGANTTLLVRAEHGSVSNAAGDATRLTTDSAVFRLARDPVPFGYVADVSRLVNRIDGSDSVPSSRYTLDTARLKGLFGLDQQWRFGAIVGSDRSKYVTTHSDPLYGGELAWSPSARTHLSAEVEHRYFGKSANLSFEHRTPFLALSLVYLRQPVDSNVTLGSAGQGGTLRSFLDSILTTRYPDPAVRSGIVQSVLNSSGLNGQAGAVDIVGDYPQLQTLARATVTYLSPRNTASVSVYSQANRQLVRQDDPLSALVPATSDFRQTGLDAQISHKLTPDMSLGGAVRWSKTAGLGTQQGQTSDERNYRVTLMQNLSPKSAVSAGIERTRFVTDATGTHSYSATLAFVGFVHRF